MALNVKYESGKRWTIIGLWGEIYGKKTNSNHGDVWHHGITPGGKKYHLKSPRGIVGFP